MNKNNLFVRSLVVALVIFITWIIAYSFLLSEPKGAISTGIISLLVLLVVIVLSENFDNFSVGKLLSMSREIKNKEHSIQKLNTENTGLRRDLVTMMTSISQVQSSTNIIGFPEDIAKKIGVERASEDEVSEKITEENEDTPANGKTENRKINYRQLRNLAFAKFLAKRGLSDFDLIKEAKLVSQFSGIDAVSNAHPIYDGYINTGESEIFIEVKAYRSSSLISARDRIYLMLNKIYLYNKIKNANAHMNLILVPLTQHNSIPEKSRRQADKLKEHFEPAIARGVLRIIELDMNENEIESLYQTNKL